MDKFVVKGGVPLRGQIETGGAKNSALPALAYDHQQMAQYALGRLKAKLEYTNIACNLLPETFTFAELEAPDSEQASTTRLAR